MTSPDSIAYPQDGYGILGGAASGIKQNGGLAVNPTEAVPVLIGDASAVLALLVASLPTALPATAGVLWNNGGVLCVS